MTAHANLANRRLEALVELLDIPPSSYGLATQRYLSLGEWFQRDGSALAEFGPAVYPQGSPPCQ